MIISGGKPVASDTTGESENMMSGKGQDRGGKLRLPGMRWTILSAGQGKIKEVKYRTSASSITTAQIISKRGGKISEKSYSLHFPM